MCVFSCSLVSDSFMTPWIVAHQAPLSMGFPRQEYWSDTFKKQIVVMVAQPCKYTQDWEFLGGPVVRIPKFHGRGHGSISGEEIKILKVMWPKIDKKYKILNKYNITQTRVH